MFVIRDRFVKEKRKEKEEADLSLNIYPCVIKYTLSLSLMYN